MSSFWTGKRVFLTGHTGFKGSWLCLWLQRLGAEVIGYSLAPGTEPSLFDLAHVSDGIRHVLGDVRDAAALLKAMQDASPDIVIHMAAQSLVHEGYKSPVATYATNVMGTVHLLEASRHVSAVRAVIVVTSDKCYDNREWVWGYRENEPMGGRDPYSNSKGCAELVTHAFRQSYFLNDTRRAQGAVVGVATARAGNVIGGGDWAANRLVPDIFRSLFAGETVAIRQPNAIRPWQHVLEPLSGYLALAEKLYTGPQTFAEAWNFGPDAADARPVQWIVEQLTRDWSTDAEWRVDGDTHPHEAHYLKLDSSKAHALLSWSPTWNLAETLHRVTEWYRAFHDGENVRDLTLQQIDEFSARVKGLQGAY